MDWKDYSVNSIIKMVVEYKRLGKGSIILMHNGAKDTPAALESIIKGLQVFFQYFHLRSSISGW